MSAMFAIASAIAFCTFGPTQKRYKIIKAPNRSLTNYTRINSGFYSPKSEDKVGRK